MSVFFSFIIPVYNRPDEVDALLSSIYEMYKKNISYEVLIIEDGSSKKADVVCEKWEEYLPVRYYFKSNSGPGSSRNFGMSKAKGNQFIILDSDVTLPIHYLKAVAEFLKKNQSVDFWGGADRCKEDFSTIQKAIDFSMTSFLTTGGIRGNKKSISAFEPRSFNMGISAEAFQASKGFGKIHPGEDPDLSFRLHKLGFKSAFNPNAYVFHKRRINLRKFQQQIRKFGLVRPILMKWHPESKKATYFLPSLFVFILVLSIVLFLFQSKFLFFLFIAYFTILFVQSFMLYKSLLLSLYVIATSFIQLYVYGTAFLESYYYIHILQVEEKEQFSELFFE